MAIGYRPELSRIRAGGRSRRTQLLLRLLPAGCYAAVAAAVFSTSGLPLERGRATLWLLGLLLCLSLGNLRGFVRSVVLEWVPLLAALTLYDVVRGAGDTLMPVHGMFQVDADRWLFGAGHVPTVWLQEQLFEVGRLSWIDYAAWGIYMSYFLASPILLGALWLVDRQGFRSYARRLTLLSFAAVAFFTLVPSIPPWLASDKGMIGGTTRIVGTVRLRWFDATSIWERGLQLANSVAAFPSLHEGMTVLLVVVLWRRVPRWLRLPLALYPVAMAFSLTYLAEHYVADLVAGALLTYAAVKVEPYLTRRAVAAFARSRPA